MLLRRFFLSCLMGAVVVSGGFAEAQSFGGKSSSRDERRFAAPSRKTLQVATGFGFKNQKSLRSFATQVGSRCILILDTNTKQAGCLPVAKAKSKHGFKFCQLKYSPKQGIPSCEAVPQLESVNTLSTNGKIKKLNLKKKEGSTMRPSCLGGISVTVNGGVIPCDITDSITINGGPPSFLDPNTIGASTISLGMVIPGGGYANSGSAGGGAGSTKDSKNADHDKCPDGSSKISQMTSCSPGDSDGSCVCTQGENYSCYQRVDYCTPQQQVAKALECEPGQKIEVFTETCSASDSEGQCNPDHNNNLGTKQVQRCVKDPDYGKDINGCKPGEQWEGNGRWLRDTDEYVPDGKCVPCQTEAQAAISIGDCLKINSDSDDGGASGAYIGQAIQECKARINSCIKKEAADNSQRDDKVTQSKCVGEEALNPASGRCEKACPDGKIDSLGVCSCANGKSTNYFSKCSIDQPTRDQPTCVEREYDNGQCRCSNGSSVQPGQSCSTTSQDKSWWDRAVSAITNTVKDIVSGLSGLVGSARNYGEEFFGSIRNRLSNIFGLGNTEQSGVGGASQCAPGQTSFYDDSGNSWSCSCPEGLQRDTSGSCN